jgi:hypothetical protein
MIDKYDEREGYCRLLGHHLNFKYCRTMSQGMPCHKILDCWFEMMDIRAFVEEHYSPEQVEAMLAAPTPKISLLVELIEEAKKRDGK